MGRTIRRSIVGMHENFLKNLNSFGTPLHSVKNADVYWGDDGTLVVVTSQKWVDYFNSRVSVLPTKETAQDEFAGEFDRWQMKESYGAILRKGTVNGYD